MLHPDDRARWWEKLNELMARRDIPYADERIKTQWPETIVIGISVNSGGGHRDAMKRAGAAVLLNKEAAVDDLYLTIQDLLNTNE